MTVQFIHIPKTGGCALSAAVRKHVRLNGHRVRLSMVPAEDQPITILRDPVARFLSAYNWHRVHAGAARKEPQWPSADALAHELGAGLLLSDVIWLPQGHWLDRDRPFLWVGRTETLDADVERLSDLLGVRLDLPPHGDPRRNEGPPHEALTPDNEAAVRHHYRTDYDLIARLTKE